MKKDQVLKINTIQHFAQPTQWVQLPMVSKGEDYVLVMNANEQIIRIQTRPYEGETCELSKVSVNGQYPPQPDW